MKLKTFFEKFDQFADAPDAVEKMRELVRQFAVTGKLVTQDKRDEPAGGFTHGYSWAITTICCWKRPNPIWSAG